MPLPERPGGEAIAFTGSTSVGERETLGQIKDMALPTFLILWDLPVGR